MTSFVADVRHRRRVPGGIVLDMSSHGNIWSPIWALVQEVS
jgi:hypothetical protein